MAFSDRCSEGAKKALALAQDAARSMGHNYVGSEHLLLGLINEGEGAVESVKKEVIELCENFPVYNN